MGFAGWVFLLLFFFFCGKYVCMFMTVVCTLVCHEETAGQRELVYRQRFFNLSNVVLKARQLSPLLFSFYCFCIRFFNFTGPLGLFNFCGNF